MVSLLGLLRESDDESERGETVCVTSYRAIRIASVVEARTEIFVGSIGRENVKHKNEDLTRKCDDGFVPANPSLKPQKAGAKEAVFLA